jgi:hypothetical protein
MYGPSKTCINFDVVPQMASVMGDVLTSTFSFSLGVLMAFPFCCRLSVAAAFYFIFAYAASNFAVMSSPSCYSPCIFGITLSKTLGRLDPYVSSVEANSVPLATVFLIHSSICGSSSAHFCGDHDSRCAEF